MQFRSSGIEDGLRGWADELMLVHRAGTLSPAEVFGCGYSTGSHCSLLGWLRWSGLRQCCRADTARLGKHAGSLGMESNGTVGGIICWALIATELAGIGWHDGHQNGHELQQAVR